MNELVKEVTDIESIESITIEEIRIVPPGKNRGFFKF